MSSGLNTDWRREDGEKCCEPENTHLACLLVATIKHQTIAQQQSHSLIKLWELGFVTGSQKKNPTLAHSAEIPPTHAHTSTVFFLSGIKSICEHNQYGCQAGDLFTDWCVWGGQSAERRAAWEVIRGGEGTPSHPEGNWSSGPTKERKLWLGHRKQCNVMQSWNRKKKLLIIIKMYANYLSYYCLFSGLTNSPGITHNTKSFRPKRGLWTARPQRSLILIQSHTC